MHPFRYTLIISALIAAGAFFPHQGYNYYVLLKWAVFGTAVWATVIEAEKKRTFAVVVFCAIALIHNPIMKFHFNRNIWLVIDGTSAAWFTFQALKPQTKKQ